MKKIILLVWIFSMSFCLFSQDITIALFQSSIKLQNDSLFLKYRVQNHSDTSYVLYNVNSIEIEYGLSQDDDENKDFHSWWAGLGALIKDKNNKIQDSMSWTMGGFRPPPPFGEDIPIPVFIHKYIILKPYEHKDINDVILISDSTQFSSFKYYLREERYKLQLTYFASKHYKSEHRKKQKRNRELQGVAMFQGLAVSNICYFDYPSFDSSLLIKRPGKLDSSLRDLMNIRRELRSLKE
ncbi:hypothetical protein LJB98_04515 [Bacteroidales bacterium OttesenSCG-928-M11]|nr:hypothetical protein [Bacteroidales bacterium OttesenSCG-928-M11]